MAGWQRMIKLEFKTRGKIIAHYEVFSKRLLFNDVIKKVEIIDTSR